jgi:prolipoprotein diacylglyceryltransferase
MGLLSLIAAFLMILLGIWLIWWALFSKKDNE